MKSNRFQVELDKIAISCRQCDSQNCTQCALNYRKLEFQWALKDVAQKQRIVAQAKREAPLRGLARIV